MPEYSRSGVDRDLFIKFVLSMSGESRFTQDAPIRPEVWAAYACYPQESGKLARHDLILTPHFKSDPFRLTTILAHEWTRSKSIDALELAELSALPSAIAAKVTFPELVEFVLPLTQWWRERMTDLEEWKDTKGSSSIAETFDELVTLSNATLRSVLPNAVDARHRSEQPINIINYLRNRVDRDKWQILFLILIVNYLIVGGESAGGRINKLLTSAEDGTLDADECQFLWPLNAVDWRDRLVRSAALAESVGDTIWAVSLNRKLSLSTFQSRLTVKADAAERVFDVDTSNVTWAIIDSGIDASHPGFLDREKAEKAGKAFVGSVDPTYSRVSKSYDFTLLRKLMAWGTSDAVLAADPRFSNLSQAQLTEFSALKKNLVSGRDLPWSHLEPLLRIPHGSAEEYRKGYMPVNKHGTHVAGIIGADIRITEIERGQPIRVAKDFTGLCPKIRLMDLRVCDDAGVGEEFVTIAAMQFVSYLNRNRDLQVVHGVNVSLSFQHDVHNSACGQTPVCVQAEELVSDGVVVVVAAGNRGYQKFQTASGEAQNFASISITDPGNAESVITVGSTHKEAPHAYGVSYFSSRGPTGDGRYKPDLLAPGEKIQSTIPGGKIDKMDGTSMAAPHVSAAAAMLIARHRELRGKPRRIKQILCESSTCLGRDRYFQGAGLLDILRALQAV